MATKEAIAAALAGVAGVTGYAAKPTILATGDAFIRWGGWARLNGFLVATYRVIIVTPQGEADADAWIYEHADLLVDALQPVLYVDSVEPTLLPAEGSQGGLFTVTITGRTE